MYPKNGTTIYLTVTPASDNMPVDNTEDDLVSIRSPIETDKPYYQLYTSTSYYSSHTKITD